MMKCVEYVECGSHSNFTISKCFQDPPAGQLKNMPLCTMVTATEISAKPGIAIGVLATFKISQEDPGRWYEYA